MTDPNHLGSKHSISLHRPQCLGGYRLVETNEMGLETCNALVGSNTSSFYYYDQKDGSKKEEFYKEYQRVHRDWSITGDSSLEAALYWKWFLVNYTGDICRKFRMEEVDLPAAWKTVTLEKVKEDIKARYQQ